MKLFFAVVLVFLLEPAAASPIMDHALPVLSDPTYTDLDGMFNPFCQYCAIPLLECICMPQAATVAAEMLYNEPQHFVTPLPDVNQATTDLAPLVAYVNEQPPLMNEHVRMMDCNQVTVNPATVQAHVLDIYLPGDRKNASQKRQAPRRDGYPCSYHGCRRTFDRACELNRHRKTHLDRSERPHLCNTCNEGFLYPKDLQRHQRKHNQQSAQVTYFCNYPGCHDLNGFSRRDNLLRHQRNKHPAIVAAA